MSARRRAAPVAAAMLAAAAAGCTRDTLLPTTPTYSAARYVPTVQPDLSIPGTGLPDPTGPTPAARASVVHGLTGVRAVAAANRGATVEPDDGSMQGATWYIEDVQSSLIYHVCTAVRRVTTILLPAGERYNGAVGGDVEAFLINVSYAGPRPAVSVLPRTGGARGNLQLVTTGGFYSYLLAPCQEAVNLVDVARKDPPARRASDLPQPEGDFTRLTLVREGDAPLPAWAPAEAWADSRKMVVRFDGPLPVLPTLFAGSQGEQLVTYRSLSDGGQVYLVTSRRVTEAELRLGAEKVRVTVDPDAIRNGTGADPAKGADAWRPAGTLAPQPVAPPMVEPTPLGAPAAPRQPMAVNPVLGVHTPPPEVRL